MVDVNMGRNGMDRCKRAGVIPYFLSGGQTFFIFGREKREISDFGGGVDISDKSPLETAEREMNEESLGIFNIKATQILNSYPISSKDSVEFFVELPSFDIEDFHKCYRNFARLRNRAIATKLDYLYEIDEILCISGESVMKIFSREEKLLTFSRGFRRFFSNGKNWPVNFSDMRFAKSETIINSDNINSLWTQST